MKKILLLLLCTVMYTASYGQMQCKICFSGNGSNGGGTNECMGPKPYGSSFTLPSCAFVKTNYTFVGWGTSPSATSTTAAGGSAGCYTVSSNDLNTNTYYAIWKCNWSYTIAYNGNGSTSGSMSSTSCACNTSYTLKTSSFSRTNYIFKGWGTSASTPNNGTVVYKENASVKDITGTTTTTVNLYAVWEGIPYNIAYNANGGSGTMDKTDCFYDKECTLRANNFTYEGFVFDGWATSADGKKVYSDEATKVKNLTTTSGATVTLYAVWISAYTLTFNAQSGSATPTQSVNIGQPAQKPADPTRAGYRFGGWCVDAEGDMPWEFSTILYGNLTLYAKWLPLATVTFDAMGGSSVPEQSVELGQPAQKPADPTRLNYTFGSWCREDHCTTKWSFDEDMVQESMTLYALWVPLYTVSFHAMSGSPTPLAQQVQQGGKVQQPTAPSREDYIFSGWYRNSTYTTAWSFASDEVTEPLTLYAKWISSSAAVFTVTFNVLSGSAVPPQQVVQGENAAQPSNPVREGFTFGGWYKEAACTNAWDFGNNAVNAATTLYALWQCTALFNTNGGSAVSAQVVRVGSKLVKPADPARFGYEFVGWYSDLCLATPYTFTGTVQGNVSLYAKWKPVE